MKQIYKYLILIIGLILIIVGGIIFYFSNRSLEDLEELDINSEQVQKLYQYIDHGEDNSQLGVYLLTNDTVNSDNISPSYKFLVALKNLEQKEIKIEEDTCSVSISKTAIDQSMEQIFNDATYDTNQEYSSFLNTDSSCGSMAVFTYDASLEQWTGQLYALGGMDGFQSPFQTKLYAAYKDNKNGYILLEEKLLFLEENCEEETCDYTIYKDYEHTDKIGEEQDVSTSTDYDFFSKYLNEASTVTYTFKLEGNQYYFYSSKIDK